jgi:hypothetical protein
MFKIIFENWNDIFQQFYFFKQYEDIFYIPLQNEISKMFIWHSDKIFLDLRFLYSTLAIAKIPTDWKQRLLAKEYKCNVTIF